MKTISLEHTYLTLELIYKIIDVECDYEIDESKKILNFIIDETRQIKNQIEHEIRYIIPYRSWY